MRLDDRDRKSFEYKRMFMFSIETLEPVRRKKKKEEKSAG